LRIAIAQTSCGPVAISYRACTALARLLQVVRLSDASPQRRSYQGHNLTRHQEEAKPKSGTKYPVGTIQQSRRNLMRSRRALVVVALIALFAATPAISQWVTTASASAVPLSADQESAYAPANDNESQAELCNSGNPRKQKKCHYNATVGDNDNDGVANGRPILGISVSNADPNEGETFTLTLHAWGDELDQVWWWVPDVAEDDNGNDNEAFVGVVHAFGCDGTSECVHTSDLTPQHPGTIMIHAKARNRQEIESGEIATEVRIHDD
jgi:hypothetical protein